MKRVVPRIGLKIPFPSGSVGSTPTSGTINSAREDGHSLQPGWPSAKLVKPPELAPCATNVRRKREALQTAIAIQDREPTSADAV